MRKPSNWDGWISLFLSEILYQFSLCWTSETKGTLEDRMLTQQQTNTKGSLLMLSSILQGYSAEACLFYPCPIILKEEEHCLRPRFGKWIWWNCQCKDTCHSMVSLKVPGDYNYLALRGPTLEFICKTSPPTNQQHVRTIKTLIPTQGYLSS